MATADATRWDSRYTGRGHDIESAAPDALVEAALLDRVPPAGRALDVACGVGAQTLWLAERGLDVTALDVSPVAISLLEAAADARDVAANVRATSFDLDVGLPAASDPFDVIVCQRFRDPDLYPQLVARLAPGGLLVITVLSQSGAPDPGPFHAPPGELLSTFTQLDCAVLHHSEADGQESIVVEANR